MTNKERFKKNIRMVELEQHSFCNRKCWFCPNQFIDRQFKPVKFLDEAVYVQILKDLAGIGYDEIISFSGNCEPFSQPAFLDRIKQAREYLPNACLMTNTNTDYLTTEMVRAAAAAGLDMIKAQLYFDETEEFTEEAIKLKLACLQKKLPGIEFEEKAKNKWFALVDDRLVIVAYAKDWRKVGHNRCDVPVRPTTKRYHTCGEAVTYIGVNYAGQVQPCCNIRADYPKYKHLVLGQMDDKPDTIFSLYQGTLLPETVYPCATCMGKQWHPNGKLVYEDILRELRNDKRLLQVS